MLTVLVRLARLANSSSILVGLRSILFPSRLSPSSCSTKSLCRRHAARPCLVGCRNKCTPPRITVIPRRTRRTRPLVIRDSFGIMSLLEIPLTVYRLNQPSFVRSFIYPFCLRPPALFSSIPPFTLACLLLNVAAHPSPSSAMRPPSHTWILFSKFSFNLDTAFFRYRRCAVCPRQDNIRTRFSLTFPPSTSPCT